MSEIKDIYSHAQALSQCSKFIKSNNFIEHVRADTAGSAEIISKAKSKEMAAIASSLSAKTYDTELDYTGAVTFGEYWCYFVQIDKVIKRNEYTEDTSWMCGND